MTDNEQIRDWIEAHYPFDGVSLDEVHVGLDHSKRNFFVYSGGARCAFASVYAPDSAPSDLGDLVDTLLALQQKDYPAEQLIPADNGAPVLEVDGWRILVKTYFEGFPVEADIQTFRRVGALLGRLHTLFDPDELEALPPAERSIPQQVSKTQEQLETVRDRVPEAFVWLWHEVYEALGHVSACDDGPRVLTHNDFHLTNILNTRANELKVIDWDGAGRDVAVIDLGFLLSSAHPRPLGDELTQPDPARIEAIVTGYRKHRRPTSAEFDCLADAVRLRVLERLASNLKVLVEQDQLDVEHGWWVSRFKSADETAQLAREMFER